MGFKLGCRGWLCCIFGMLLSTYLLWVAWIGFQQELQLRSIGVTVLADVHEGRMSSGKYGPRYKICYSFQVNGHAERFDQRYNLLGWCSDTWSSVSEFGWRRARKLGIIEVVYLPDNPAVNRIEAEETPLVEFVSAGLLSLISAAGVVFILVVTYTGSNAEKRDQSEYGEFKKAKTAQADANWRALFTPPFDRKEPTLWGLGNQIKLVGCALGSAALGVLLAVQGYRSLVPADAELTHGQVISSQQTRRFLVERTLLTVRISGTETVVKAIVLGDSIHEAIPRHVSFYYSGDPTQEIYFPEDTGGLYVGLAFIAAGGFFLVACFWDRIRGRHPSSSAKGS